MRRLLHMMRPNQSKARGREAKTENGGCAKSDPSPRFTQWGQISIFYAKSKEARRKIEI